MNNDTRIDDAILLLIWLPLGVVLAGVAVMFAIALSPFWLPVAVIVWYLERRERRA